MGESRQRTQGSASGSRSALSARRIVGSLIAAVAVSDLAYRLLVRESLRRALGIDVKHA